MPIYTISAPDGNTYSIEGPDGASQQEVIQHVLAQYPEAGNAPKTTSAGFSLSDLARSAGSSVAGGLQALTGVAGANNPVSNYLGDVSKSLQEGISPERKAEMQARQAKIAAAEKTGNTWEQIKAGLGAVADAPLQSLASGAGSMVTPIAAGAAAIALAPEALVGYLGANVLSLTAIGTVGAAMGSGQTKQDIFDRVKKEYMDAKVPEAEAEKKAMLAQNWVGKNIDQIAINAGTGALEAATGVGRILAPGKAAIKAAAKAPSLLKTVNAAGLEEAAPEVAQSLSGTAATNVAASREGFEAPTFQGAAAPAAESGLTAFLLGSAAGPKEYFGKRGEYEAKQRFLEQQRAAEEAAAAPKPPDITDPAYLQQIQTQYQEAEKRKADLRSQLRKVEEGSITETADRLHNKEIEEQIKAMTPELEQLAAEYNKASKVAPAFTPEAAPGPVEVPEAVKVPEAPKPTMTVGDALDNPLGRFTKEELSSRSPKVVDYIDEQRKKLGKPALNDYSIEDIRDAMPGELPDAEKADLNSLIAAKTGYTPEVTYKPEDIINVAKQKNIATDTDGFKFFLQRATGDNDLTKMEQPQLHSAFKALSELPTFDETQYLPEKTNAVHYSPNQYRSAVQQVSSLTSEKDVPSSQALQVTKKATGLTRDSDAQLLLQNAYTNGDLNLSSSGEFITAQAAPQGEFKIEEGFAPATPTGFNVVRGDQVLYSTQNEDEAKAKVESLSKTADPAVKQIDKSIANERNTIAASQRSLDIMEAGGMFRTPKYQQASAQHAALVEKANENIQRLSEKKAYLQQPVTIQTTGKPSNVKTYKVKEKGVSEKAFNTREEALKHALENLPAARLNELASQTKSPGFAKRLQAEIERRKNPPKQFVASKPKVEAKVEPQPETTAQKEAIKSQLLPMLKKFGLGDVALQIVEGMKDEGSYKASVIKVALDANNPVRVLRHESLHGLKDLGFFTPGQWKVLENQANKVWIDKYLKQRNINGQPIQGGQQSRFEAYQNLYDGDINAIREEAIADAFGDFDVNGAPKGLLSTLLQKMRQFFEGLRNAFNGAGFQTSDDVFGKVERGELKATAKATAEEKPSLNAESPDNFVIERKSNYRGGTSEKVEWILRRISDNRIIGEFKKKSDAQVMKDIYSLPKEEVFKKYPELRATPSLREDPSQAAKSTDAFKADAQTIKAADDYEAENGIRPYVSEGFLDLPKDGTKYSIQSYDPDKHLSYDAVLGMPINKNGTVTLYYHTTKENAVKISNKKVIPSEGRNRIYLTNESVGADVLRDRGNFDQELDGSTVLVYAHPDMLQMDDAEYKNGRKDFYIPLAQGDFFNKKMKLQSIQKSRTSPITDVFSYSDHEEKIAEAVKAYKDATPTERRKLLSDARKTLKQEHNVSSLLSENGKLEKTRVGEYDLDWEGNSVASMGLGLASAQQISEKVSTCPRSAICEGLCLGETSGGNLMFGGAASEDVNDIQKSSFRAAARMMQYLKTEALVIHPKEFATLLQAEIDSLKKWCESETQVRVDKETKKRYNEAKEIYQPAVRLNVTSDFKPAMFRAIIDENPGIEFYDYTKLGSESIADNHHLTYSSTGFGQIVNGEKVFFKDKSGNYDHNWATMRKRLDNGQNVAMAFSSKSGIPSFLSDEETGNTYRVWNGDDYDARFLDPKQPDGKGMIIGLKNKAGTLSEKTATQKTGGFFVHYDPKTDGDTVVVPDQQQFQTKPKKVFEIKPEKLSLRTAPNTPEFKRWFNGSKVVDQDGKPMVMYHGTNKDFNKFLNAEKINRKGNPDGFYFTPSAAEASKYAGEEGGANVMPVYLSIKNPFLNKSRVTTPMVNQFEKELRANNPNLGDSWFKEKIKIFRDRASWENRWFTEIFPNISFPSDAMTRVLEAGGYDGFKDGNHFIAIRPEQIKSAIGNIGTYDINNPDIRYSLRTAPDTLEFKRWFGDSKIVDADGKPKVMYHGLAKDTTDFSRKTNRGVPIFLTDNPEFAGRFAKDSFDSVAKNPSEYLTKDQLNSGIKKALAAIKKDYGNSEEANTMIRSITSGGTSAEAYKFKDATPEAKEYLRNAFKDMLPTGPHIMPVYVRAEKPFNYANPSHVNRVLAELTDAEDLWEDVRRGSWETIESESVQNAIKLAGFDSFYVLEHGVKNLAVYEPTQIKSAIGNIGAYDINNPDVRYSLRTNVAEDIRNMPNGAAIEAAINRTTTTRQEVGFVERMTSALAPESFSYLRQKALDRYNRLNDVEKLIATQMGGIQRLADQNAHAAALQSDTAAGVAASALGVGNRIGGIPVYRNGYTTVSNENGTVKGAVEIFAPLARYGDPKIYQAYQFWAGAKRGKRLLASGREELYTPQDMAYAKQLEQKYPEFVSVQKDWIKYNDGLVKYAVDTGVISAQNAAEFTRYSDYVPFYRQLDGERTVGPNIFQSISGVKAPKKLSGSEAPLADFLETITRNTQSIIQAGMKNVAAQKAVKGGMMIGMVRKMDYVASGPNSITIFEKGQKVSYECADKLWVDAVSSLNLPELPFLNFLAMPANFLRAAVTKDPGFMLANLMRDSISAYVTSGAKLTPVASAVKEMGNVLMNNSPEYQKLLSAGVLGGYEFSRNVEASTEAFAKDLRKKTGTRTGLESAMSPLTFFWDKLEKGTEASDAATRIAVYKATLAETGNEAEAIHRALEVMNFNRKGSSAVVRIAAAAIPFLNARIQGLDVFFRAGIRPFLDANATEQEKQVQKAMIIRGMTLLGLSVMYAAAVSGDPDYEKQEEETKDNNWIIPMGEGKTPLKIPIPFEVGTLFKTIPERIYRSYLMPNEENRDTTDDLQKSMRRAIQSTFMINPVPQVVAPLLEARDNYSVFTQRPIVGQNMQGIAPEFQVGPGTSKWAELLGQQAGMSPMMIDHVFKGYTGTMGVYAADLLDAGINAVSASNVEKPSKRIEQMPIIKRFLADPEARGKITSYFDLKHAVDTTVRTINLLEKQADPNLPDYVEKNAQLFAARDFMNNLNKQMDELQQQANMIRAADIPADEKRDMLTEITKAQNLLVNDIRQIRNIIRP